jgi:hypothetical protein
MYLITGVNRQDLLGCWILGILISPTAPGRVQVTFRLCFHQMHSSLSETNLALLFPFVAFESIDCDYNMHFFQSQYTYQKINFIRLPVRDIAETAKFQAR